MRVPGGEAEPVGALDVEVVRQGGNQRDPDRT